MKKFLIIAAVFLSVLSVSCSSKSYFEAIKAPEQKFYQGDYLGAARMLLPEVNNKGRDQLLYMMECGYMLHAGADYEKSNSILLPAGKLAKVVPTSVTQQITALLSNQTSTNYKGEDFEKVLVHMFLGINFLKMGETESARVEFKLVNEELSKIRAEGNTSKYKQNLMAKYLTAVAYEITARENNDLDDLEYAYKEYEQINILSPGYGPVKADLIRVSKRLGYNDDAAKWSAQFGNVDKSFKDAGELVVILQSGKSAVKKSRGKLLSDSAMKVSIDRSLRRISLKEGVTIAAIMVALNNAENPIPRFVERSDNTSYVKITAGNTTAGTIPFEDISNTAVNNLKEDYSSLQVHLAASIVTKAAASIAAGIAAKKIAEKAGAGSFAGLIGTVAGAGTGAALFSSMGPDLRCWHTLPARLHLGRIFLAPGNYDVKLDYINKKGNVAETENVPVTIKTGGIEFINKRTLL